MIRTHTTTRLITLGIVAVSTLTLAACGIPGQEEIAGATQDALAEQTTEDAIADAIKAAIADGETQESIAIAVTDAVAEVLGDAAVLAMIQSAVENALIADGTIAGMESAVELALSKVTLAETIAAAKGMVAVAEEGVSVGSFEIGSTAELETAIAAAELVDDDPDATLAEIKQANEDLTVATIVFMSKVIMVNVTQLVSAIAAANGLMDAACLVAPAECLTGGGLDGAITGLEDVLDDAQDVVDDPDSSQEDVEGAEDAVEDATDDFCDTTGAFGYTCP